MCSELIDGLDADEPHMRAAVALERYGNSGYHSRPPLRGGVPWVGREQPREASVPQVGSRNSPSRWLLLARSTRGR
jgi:hypothetical protein